jgi:hypothetical protein
MAARLETASRQYGVPLLVSQDFYELLSPFVQKLMRRLDVVTVKGSETPIEVYTYDTNSKQIRKESTKASPSTGRRGSINTPSTRSFSLSLLDLVTNENKETEKIKKRSKSLIKRHQHSVFNSWHDPDDVIAQDIDLVNLRSHIDDDFTKLFAKGVNKYISGDWSSSKCHLERCDVIMRENPYANGCDGDGPSLALLKYMASHNFTAPSTWLGFRPLHSK